MSEQPLASPEAEAALVACLLLCEPHERRGALAVCPPGAFVDARLGRVAEAVLALGDAADETTVGLWLQERGELEGHGGMTGICHLTDAAASPAHLGTYAETVRELWDARRAVAAMRTHALKLMRRECKAADVATGLPAELRDICAEGSDGTLKPMDEIIRRAVTDLQRERDEGVSNGVQTGFAELDYFLTGLKPGELTVVAGRPSMGKSAFVCELLRHSRARALLVSIEMSEESVAMRFLCAAGSVDSRRYQERKLMDIECTRLMQCVESVAGLPIHLFDSGAPTVADIERHAYALHARGGFDLLVVDYLQIVRPGRRSDSREREVAEITAGLRALGKALRVHTICLSQLSRGCEARQDKRPILSDLRESGAIEQDADNVLMLYRDDYYNKNSPREGKADILIRKNRNGPCGEVEVHFDSQYVRFRGKSWQG